MRLLLREASVGAAFVAAVPALAGVGAAEAPSGFRELGAAGASGGSARAAAIKLVVPASDRRDERRVLSAAAVGDVNRGFGDFAASVQHFAPVAGNTVGRALAGRVPEPGAGR